MNIIAFDTATDTFSAGLSLGKQSFFFSADGAQKHSELIMDSADILLRIAGIAKSDLEAVACMEGPGSFTGLRIGFAAAKGLALALGIPIIPVPTLDCIARYFSFFPGIVIPVIDAKKNAFYTAMYFKGQLLTDYLDIEIEPLIKTIAAVCKKQQQPPDLFFTGPAAQMVSSALQAAFPGAVVDYNLKRGHIVELLKFASETDIINTNKESFAKGPLYLRMSDAELCANMGNQDG